MLGKSPNQITHRQRISRDWLIDDKVTPYQRLGCINVACTNGHALATQHTTCELQLLVDATPTLCAEASCQHATIPEYQVHLTVAGYHAGGRLSARIGTNDAIGHCREGLLRCFGSAQT